jgi:mannose-6-phosphate isomerase
VKPLALPPNLQPRFYRGGPRIAQLRGIAVTEDHVPEDWVGSTTTAFGDTRGAGLSRLEDGELVRDVVAADPEAFFGSAHVEALGPDAQLLVKLLDAGQRLPAHYHPGRPFARAALGSEHGKTEAWLIVSAEAGADVHLGFRSDVDLTTVRDWIERQDVAAMLAALNRLPVAAGDALLVPAGTPHVIGEGILLLELQEPSDFSILLESEGFVSSDADAHLGLGWERALEALDRTAWGPARLASIRVEPRPAAGRAGAFALLPDDAAPYFRAELLAPQPLAELDEGFSILVATEGGGELVTTDGERCRLEAGDALLVPHAAGACTLSGEVRALRCRPPDPAAGNGRW